MNSSVVILFGASFIVSLVVVFARWTQEDTENIKRYYLDPIRDKMTLGRQDDEIQEGINIISIIIFARRTPISSYKEAIETGLGKIKTGVEKSGYITNIDQAMKIIEGIAKICKDVNNYEKTEIRDPVIPGRDQLQAIYVAAATYLLKNEGLITRDGQPTPEIENKSYLAPVLSSLKSHRIVYINDTTIRDDVIPQIANEINGGFNNENVCPQVLA